MSKKRTGCKWNTDNCPRCGESHHDYSIKLDSHKNKYVICGITNDKIIVDGLKTRTFAIGGK